MAAVKRHLVLHYSDAYIFWSFVVIEPIPGVLENALGSLMRSNWPKLAGLAQEYSYFRLCFISVFIDVKGHSV